MTSTATVFTVIIPGRVPEMRCTGTPDEIVTWMRDDWNAAAEDEKLKGFPVYPDNAAYIRKITELTVRRSSVTPKWKPNDESVEPLDFLLYMQAVSAIQFQGDNAPESEQLYATELADRHNFHREVNELTGKMILAWVVALGHQEQRA